MSTRISWMEKQLAAWDDIENAANFCRDWHRMRPVLRQQALTALEEWQRAKVVLSGGEKESIELTVVSALGLPKSNFFSSNAWVKVVFYVQRGVRTMRTLEVKTEVSKATQNPVWNKSWPLDIPMDSKMVDLELYDRVAGLDKQLTKVRLSFSRVEASFANRSLMYGLDEAIDFPLKFAEGKGKEKETHSVLRLGLKWTGRMDRVEKLGLVSRPPGKMFRTDLT
ncbi:hypothetical protein LSUE1_G000255, partial [Lachnellula suecica]